MTFTFFLDCSLLAFGPSFAIYKALTLNTKSMLTKTLFLASVACILTQLAKGLLLATFVPSSENSSVFEFDQEIMKSFIGFVEILGMFVTIKYFIKRQQEKEVALGWATAENVVTHLLPFWIYARQLQFDWGHFFSALDANINLVQTFVFAGLVKLFINRQRRSIFAALSFFPIQPMLINFLRVYLELHPIYIILLRVAFFFGIYKSWKILRAQSSREVSRKDE